MGGEAWHYFSPYMKNVDEALQSIRQVEFKAGRYSFPGKKPSSLDALIENMPESGTRSILDMLKVSDNPEILAVSPFPLEELTEILGTGKPNHKVVATHLGDLVQAIGARGEGRFIVVYKENKPNELFFFGISID